jgi:predicted ATP-grasp superfamily ATP-dependent carboligase
MMHPPVAGGYITVKRGDPEAAAVDIEVINFLANLWCKAATTFLLAAS